MLYKDKLSSFKNTKLYSCSNRDEFKTIIIELDSIQTGSSINKMENDTIVSTNIERIENELEKIKVEYSNEIQKHVIDKRISET